VDKNKTAADISGVTENTTGHQDLTNLATCIITYGVVCLVCVTLFCFLRLYLPAIFAYYVHGGDSPAEEQAPCSLPPTLLGWIRPTFFLTLEEIENCCGLDQAMLIEFCNLAFKIFALVGIPLLVMMPTTYLYGGNRFTISDLNRFGLESLQDGSVYFWLHACFVWYVLIVAEELIICAQKSFQRRRYHWLKRMSEPRANTILVQRIAPEHRSDEALKRYFTDLFGEERIKSASVVKRTGDLKNLVKRLKEAVANNTSDATEEQKELERQVVAERERIFSEAEMAGGKVNTPSGFVTFHSRRDAQAALFLHYSGNQDNWIVSVPPSPEDVFWEDLLQEPHMENGNEVIGYTCVVMLYLGFVPVVVGLTSIAEYAEGTIKSTLFHAIVPTLGLLLFTSFLPTVLIFIFDKFFVTKAIMWMQKKLQDWYTFFQVIFVLLVTMVGSSLADAAAETLARPLSIGILMANKMPKCSRFYLNYMIMQCMATCLEITRYMNLIKFMIFRRGTTEARARELSEPEDQDYYGIGSRSARWTVNMLIGLVFCPICPLICVVTLVKFFLCKLLYGYLLVFAETRKVDLGGAFWVAQLRHVQHGLWIFWLLMCGVLTARARRRQALLAVFSAVYLLWARRRFGKLRWENLPFEEVQGFVADSLQFGSYVQPELSHGYVARAKSPTRGARLTRPRSF